MSRSISKQCGPLGTYQFQGFIIRNSLQILIYGTFYEDTEQIKFFLGRHHSSLGHKPFCSWADLKKSMLGIIKGKEFYLQIGLERGHLWLHQSQYNKRFPNDHSFLSPLPILISGLSVSYNGCFCFSPETMSHNPLQETTGLVLLNFFLWTGFA